MVYSITHSWCTPTTMCCIPNGGVYPTMVLILVLYMVVDSYSGVSYTRTLKGVPTHPHKGSQH